MHEANLLSNTVVLFGVALVIAWLFRVLRAPAVIGFLIAGTVIGPSGLKLIHRESVEQFAELGLILLLFTVGLELSPEPLIRAGRRLVTAALVQMLTTAIVAFGILCLTTNTSVVARIIVAAAVCLSSTAIVLRQLAERRETSSPAGTITTGILLLQDVAAILFMILLPMLGSAAAGGWMLLAGRTAARGAIFVVGLLVLRRVLPALVNQLLRQGGWEMLALFSVVVACAGAWLASLAGWSPALGAAVAGLLLAETDVRHQLSAEIAPFHDVFNALFFISLGMLVDLSALIPNARWIAIAVIVTLILKTLLTVGAVAVAGWPLRLAIQVGMGLCTVSEFGYVLASEAARLGLLSHGLLGSLTAYMVGTMLLGAVFVPVAPPIAFALARLSRGRSPTLTSEFHAATSLQQHVIIVGYGLNGSNLARVLKEVGIAHCVIEMNRTLARQAAAGGRAVVIGDATRRSILSHAGLATARSVVVAIDDQKATRRIVAQARAARPDVYVLARTRYVSELETLLRLGAAEVIPEEFETSIEIFAHVLRQFAVPDNVVEAQIVAVRAGRYGMLRGRPADRSVRSDFLAFLEATATQTYLLDGASPAAGRTIRQFNLRAETGVTIIAVVRAGKPQTNPSPDFGLQAGDVLVLVGAHKQLDVAKERLAARGGVRGFDESPTGT